MTAQNVAPQVYAKPTGEVRKVSISFADILESDESLSGTPTITASSSGIATASPAVNSTGTLVILGTTVAANKAVTFTVSGGTTGKRYGFLVTCSSSVSTFKRRVLLDVIANTT